MYACAAGCVGDLAILGGLMVGAGGALYIQSKSADIAQSMEDFVDWLSSFAKDGTKKADELIPGTGKRSPSYYPPYGDKTYDEIKDLAKKGDQRAKDMKKLIEREYTGRDER